MFFQNRQLPGHEVDHLHPVPRLRTSGAIPQLSTVRFYGLGRDNFNLFVASTED